MRVRIVRIGSGPVDRILDYNPNPVMDASVRNYIGTGEGLADLVCSQRVDLFVAEPRQTAGTKTNEVVPEHSEIREVPS